MKGVNWVERLGCKKDNELETRSVVYLAISWADLLVCRLVEQLAARKADDLVGRLVWTQVASTAQLKVD